MTHSPDEAMQIEAIRTGVVKKFNLHIKTKRHRIPSMKQWGAWVLNKAHMGIGRGISEEIAILDLAEKLGLEKDYD